MTKEKQEMLVLKSGAGEYYVLPEELLERGRVPAEYTAEVERVFAKANSDDVAGHLNFTKIEFKYLPIGTLVGASTAIGATFHNVGHNGDREMAAHSAGQLK